MVVRWPGKVPTGKTSDFVWDMRDVFPTCCDLAGTTCPENLDGLSVLPALLGQTPPEREHLYWEHPQSQQAVRMGKWKGLRVGTKNPVQLFDLSTDPAEGSDLASEHPEVVARIETIMAESHTPSQFWPLSERVSQPNRESKSKSKDKEKLKHSQQPKRLK